MDRRKFLRVSLMGLAGALVPVRVQAMAPSTLASSASVRTILDAGLERISGQVRATLGPGYTLMKVFEYQGQIFARVSYQGHIFHLKSTDGATWFTAEWSPPYNRQYVPVEKRHG